MYACPQEIICFFNSNTYCILIGDFNAKNTAWNSRLISPQGNTLFNLCCNLNLNIYTPYSPTHFPYLTNVAPDNLDFAISKNISNALPVQVLPFTHSDNCPILLSLNLVPNKITDPCPFSFLTINWAFFQVLLSRICPRNHQLNSPKKILDLISSFNHSVLDTIDLMIPPLPNTHHNPLPQFLLNKITIHRKNLRRYNYYRTPLLKTLLSRIIKQLRKDPQAFYYFKFHKTIAIVNPNDSTFYKLTRKLERNKNTIELIKTPSECFIKPKNIANVLASHFNKTFTSHNLTDPNTSLEVNSFLQAPLATAELPTNYVSPLELTTIINHLKPSTRVLMVSTILFLKSWPLISSLFYALFLTRA